MVIEHGGGDSRGREGERGERGRRERKGKKAKLGIVSFLISLTEFLDYHGYFNAVKTLIEDTYAINGNTPVSIVTHSYGGPVSLYFLTQVGRGLQDNTAHTQAHIHMCAC